MTSENPYEAPKAELGSSDQSQHDGPSIGGLDLFFSFRGRIPRRSYWLASIAAVAAYVGVCIGAMFTFGEESNTSNAIVFIAYAMTIWSSLAIQTKRWHDRDKSGRWILVNFIPILGPLWALVGNGFLRGTHGANSYGHDPT